MQNTTSLIIKGESGLQACIYALKRHTMDFIEHIVPVFIQFGRNNYMELFLHHLRSFFPEKALYLSLAHDIFALIINTSVGKLTLLNSMVLDQWLQIAIR